MSHCKRALVVCSYGIGNTILKTPIMQALNERDYAVDVVTDGRPVLGSDIHTILDGQDYLNKVYQYNPYGINCFSDEWQKHDYELVVATIPNDKPFSEPALSRVSASKIIVGESPKIWIKHEVEENLDLVDAPYDYIPKLEVKTFANFPPQLIGKKYIVLANTAKQEGKWPKKRLPPKRLAEIIREIYGQLELPIAIVGGPKDKPYSNELISYLEISSWISSSNYYDFTGGTSLIDTAAIIKGASVCVASDSGPMHLASALGIPVVGLFIFTNPIKNRPYGPYCRYVQAENCSCQDGKAHNCSYPECAKSLSIDTIMRLTKEIYGF